MAMNVPDGTKYEAVKTCLIGTLTVSTVVGIGFVIFATVIDRGIYPMSVVLVLACFAVANGLQVFSIGFFQGHRRFDVMAALNFVVLLIQVAGAAFLLLLGVGPIAIVLSFAAAALAVTAIGMNALRKYPFWNGKGANFRSIVNFSAGLFVSISAFTILWNVDIVVVKALARGMLIDVDLGYYAAALNLARLPFAMVGVIPPLLFPLMVRFPEQRLYRARHGLRYTLLIVTPALAVFLIAPQRLLSVVYPAEYEHAANFLRIAGVSGIVWGMIELYRMYLDAEARVWIAALALLTGLIVQAALLIGLVPHWGVIGGATATAVASISIMVALAWAHDRCRSLLVAGVDGVRLVVPAIITGTCVLIGGHWGPLGTLAGSIVGGVAYLAGLRVVGFTTAEERQVVSDLAHSEGKWQVPARLASFVVGRSAKTRSLDIVSGAR
jgi:O-antigen/teichoic acid export membrane protein